MKAKELQQRLSERFHQKGWNAIYDHEKDQFEVKVEGRKQPFEVSVPKLLDRIKSEGADPEQVIQEVVDQMSKMMATIEKRHEATLQGSEENIFPVMRSKAFPTESPNGDKLVHEEHTAESSIYFALDLGEGYSLIDEQMLQEANWSKQELKERALFNLRRLPNKAKKDTVAGNDFYFISIPDGYAASRILNQSLLQEYAQKVEGGMCVAIPHQDVLIIADLRNAAGYDVLGQMGFHFYTNGPMPITALPFEYKEGQLEPIFILAKNKPQGQRPQKDQ